MTRAGMTEGHEDATDEKLSMGSSSWPGLHDRAGMVRPPLRPPTRLPLRTSPTGWSSRR
jgi:hypothetical protein